MTSFLCKKLLVFQSLVLAGENGASIQGAHLLWVHPGRCFNHGCIQMVWLVCIPRLEVYLIQSVSTFIIIEQSLQHHFQQLHTVNCFDYLKKTPCLDIHYYVQKMGG